MTMTQSAGGQWHPLHASYHCEGPRDETDLLVFGRGVGVGPPGGGGRSSAPRTNPVAWGPLGGGVPLHRGLVGTINAPVQF